MSFEEALKLLKQDKAVRRTCWSRDSRLYCVNPDGVSSHKLRSNAYEHVGKTLNPNEIVTIHPHIDRVSVTRNGATIIEVGWVPRQSDLFADDWEVINENTTSKRY